MLLILQCSHDPDDEIGQNIALRGGVGAQNNSLQGEDVIYVKNILYVLSSMICPQRYIQNNFDG